MTEGPIFDKPLSRPAGAMPLVARCTPCSRRYSKRGARSFKKKCKIFRTPEYFSSMIPRVVCDIDISRQTMSTMTHTGFGIHFGNYHFSRTRAAPCESQSARHYRPKYVVASYRRHFWSARSRSTASAKSAKELEPVPTAAHLQPKHQAKVVQGRRNLRVIWS